MQRRFLVRGVGAIRKANVGISNDNAGEKPAHRKTKVSCLNDNRSRVSRDLRRTRKAKPMDNWLIFQYLLYTAWGDGVDISTRSDGSLR